MNRRAPVLQVRLDGWVHVELPRDETGRYARHALRRVLSGGDMETTPFGVRVRPTVISTLLETLEHYYEDDEIKVLDPEEGAVPLGGDVVAADPLTAMDGLDPALAKKAYRALASVLHPDAGGDEDAFKRLQDWKAGQGG